MIEYITKKEGMEMGGYDVYSKFKNCEKGEPFLQMLTDLVYPFHGSKNIVHQYLLFCSTFWTINLATAYLPRV